jgi:hypothetical protein
MNAVPGQNPIVVRYLRGEMSLESAASAMARVIREFSEAFADIFYLGITLH